MPAGRLQERRVETGKKITFTAPLRWFVLKQVDRHVNSKSRRSRSEAVYFDRAGRSVRFYQHHACAISRAAAVSDVKRSRCRRRDDSVMSVTVFVLRTLNEYMAKV